MSAVLDRNGYKVFVSFGMPSQIVSPTSYVSVIIDAFILFTSSALQLAHVSRSSFGLPLTNVLVSGQREADSFLLLFNFVM